MHISLTEAATPTRFTLEMPDSTGVTGLADCDLEQARDGGCKIKFSHASSISSDGWFHGKATVEWAISSDASRFDGVDDVTTVADFKIQVAEAMAVS